MAGQGQPNTRNPASKHLGMPWREIVLITADRRLSFSGDIIRRAGWLKAGSELLMVIGSQLVRLLPWEPHGPRIWSRMEQLASDPETDPEILALQARYSRLKVTSEGRLPCPTEMCAALGLQWNSPAYITIIVGKTEASLQSTEIAARDSHDEPVGEFP